ncbi:MAG: hypothetical protein AAF614_00920 [Chloroflexota bacterium]
MSRRWIILSILLASIVTIGAPFALFAAPSTPNLTVEHTIRIQTADGEVKAPSQTLASTETAQIFVHISSNSADPTNFVLVEQLTPTQDSADVCQSQVAGADLHSDNAPTRRLWDVPAPDAPGVSMMVLELPPNGSWEGTIDVKSRALSQNCRIEGTLTIYAQTAVPIDGSCNPNRTPRCRYEGWTPRADDVAQLLELPPIVADPIELNIVNPDLGDAPDSTNHFGVPMSAYPGVQASFPTVFDPATGVPSGPKHLHSHPLHLGQGVTREREADLNPQRNLRPPTNTANMDRRDDGVNVSALAFNNCQTTTIPYRITVNQGALDYFAEQGAAATAYLNIWVDGNFDGDWDEIVNCNGTPAAEHIVINHPIDLNALGIGTHNLTVVSELAPWSNPSHGWLRASLSDSPAPLTLSQFDYSHGDGSGPADAYMLGETEDFLLPFNNNGADATQRTARMFGPDLAVTLDGEITTSHDDPKDPPDDDDDDDWRWRPLTATLKINFANFGTSAAPPSRLTAQIDGFVPDEPFDIRVMHYPHCNGTVCESGEINQVCDDLGCRIEMDLVDFQPGDHGQIMVLGWRGCLTCIDVVAPTAVTTLMPLEGSADLNPDNNTAEQELPFTPNTPPRITAPFSGSTSESDVTVEGVGEPGRALAIFVDGFEIGTVNVLDDGTWSTAEMLPEGMHNIWVCDTIERQMCSTDLILVVDSSQLWNPTSGTMTLLDGPDGASEMGLVGRNGRSDSNNWLLPVIADKNYRLDIPVNCNQVDSIRFGILGFVDPTEMTDADNDGTYEVGFMAKAGMNGATAGFQIDCNGMVRQYTGSVIVHELGHVLGVSQDAFSDMEIEIFALSENGNQQFRHEHTRVQPDGNGRFHLWLPRGDYELVINHDGYQSFRTLAPNHAGLLLPTVQLTPCNNCTGSRLAQSAAASHTVGINENGFEAAFLTVAQGDIVNWQNGDLEPHALVGTGVASGDLLGGSSYQTQFDTLGTFTLYDSQNELNTITVIVEEGDSGYAVYLPLIKRP